MLNCSQWTLLTVTLHSDGHNLSLKSSARFGLIFYNVLELTISNITISVCVRWLRTTPFVNILGPTIAATLFLANIRDVYIDTVLVQRTSPGYGLIAINILGNSTIRNSSFHFNNEVSYLYLVLNLRPLGGNILLVFTDSADCEQSNYPHNLSITTTVLTSGHK